MIADREIKETGIWEYLKCTSYIFTHTNHEIKKLAFIVVHNILYKGQFENVSVFVSEVMTDNDEDIFHLFYNSLKHEEDAIIL